jgi:hypothetical protein
MFQLKSLVAYAFLVFFGFHPLDHGEVWGADWIFLERDEQEIWFYDSENVERHADNLIRVRTKKFYEKRGVLKAVEKYGKDYMNLDHVLSVWEIDSPQKKFRLLSAIFYSKDKSIIQGYNDDKVKYFALEDIPPDSYIELVCTKVCNKKGIERK